MKLSFYNFSLALVLAGLPAGVHAQDLFINCMYIDAGSLWTTRKYSDEAKADTEKASSEASGYVVHRAPSFNYECPKHVNDWKGNAINCYYLSGGGTLWSGYPKADKDAADTDAASARASGYLVETVDLEPNGYSCPKRIEDFYFMIPTEAPTSAPTAAPKTPNASGDPHFETWNGAKFDFHGGCDLFLIQNPNFADGLGMTVQARTEIRTSWSYIKAVAVQIGTDTLEVEGGIGAHYMLNGGPKIPLTKGEVALGDFPVHIIKFDDKSSKLRIELGDRDALAIQTFKHFVRFDVSDKSGTAFAGSSGLLGSYPGGEMTARDGITVLQDANEFGQEWMVRPTDSMLFYGADPSELPLKCPMPSHTMEEGRRRLGESAITLEDATQACARVGPADQDACIFDVMATNDKEMAGSY